MMAGLNAGTPASTIFGKLASRIGLIAKGSCVDHPFTDILPPSCAVGNLAYEVSEQQLIDYFSQVGPVKNIRWASGGGR